MSFVPVPLTVLSARAPVLYAFSLLFAALSLLISALSLLISAFSFVFPAKAGIQPKKSVRDLYWIPACAGKTRIWISTIAVKTPLGSLGFSGILKFIFLLVIAFLHSACDSPQHTVNVYFENLDGTKSPLIKAEVVATEASRQKGLMYRKSLAENAGMLFIFPNEQYRSFWMKNTYIPLDIIYLDSSFRVGSIVKNARPHSEAPLRSEKRAQYVLELIAGSADRMHIAPESRLVIQGRLPEPTY